MRPQKPMKTEEWQEKAAFIGKLRELTDRLNRCRAAYEAHTPLVSDGGLRHSVQRFADAGKLAGVEK